jgi:TonB family protein
MLRVKVLIFLFVAFVPILGAQLKAASPIVLLAEDKLRKTVTASVVPEFPEEARTAGAQGLVIAVVHFDEDGNLLKTRVLKSPHPEISLAVTKALTRWKVTPYLVDSVLRARIQSELRFYYVIKDGVGVVHEPSIAEQKRHSREYRKIDLEFRRS